tara:strand:+ start:1010 stop:1243 length:234 start_codon:yes stop_codon:yes gene_type:complete
MSESGPEVQKRLASLVEVLSTVEVKLDNLRVRLVGPEPQKGAEVSNPDPMSVREWIDRLGETAERCQSLVMGVEEVV